MPAQLPRHSAILHLLARINTELEFCSREYSTQIMHGGISHTSRSL
jgi:hypothetical protein